MELSDSEPTTYRQKNGRQSIESWYKQIFLLCVYLPDCYVVYTSLLTSTIFPAILERGGDTIRKILARCVIYPCSRRRNLLGRHNWESKFGKGEKKLINRSAGFIYLWANARENVIDRRCYCVNVIVITLDRWTWGNSKQRDLMLQKLCIKSSVLFFIYMRLHNWL